MQAQAYGQGFWPPRQLYCWYVSAQRHSQGTLCSVSDLSPVDLRELMHALGPGRPEPALTATPADRELANVEVDILETDSSEVSEEPLAIRGVVDGIQSSLCLTYRSHMPVFLSYTAAGCLGEGRSLLELRQRLEIVCSEDHADWARELPGGLPVKAVTGSEPWEVEKSAVESLAGSREELERAVVSSLVEREVTPLLVDGSLVARPVSQGIVGVVKDTSRKYLSDESSVVALPAGWRSAAFRLPAGFQGVSQERYSCYVRLFPATNRRWNFGLVRIESTDRDTLGPLAARVLAERQSSQSRDHRWDRHLASVRACEDVLRALRPALFGLY